MNNIRIVYAGAGTGKTERLGAEVVDAVNSGKEPDTLLATTFTVKAAAELQGRARRKLLEAQHEDKAMALQAARIGTVNSVCGALVKDFALEAGLSPRMQVADEVSAALALERAMSDAVTREQERELGVICSRIEHFEWVRCVREVVNAARANQIASDKLDELAEASITGFLKYYGQPKHSADELDKELQRACEKFVADSEMDTTAVTARVREKAERCASRLAAGRPVFWKDWADLADATPGAGCRELAERTIRLAAAAHDCHPRLHEDIKGMIRLVFAIAKKTLADYDAHKKAWGLIDFTDQEVMALELLRRDDVRERLREQVQLVLVDEFQDTSPIQLAIFLELAKVAPCVWVGDQKQAIYGFRGTDPALMDAAIAALETSGGSVEPLSHSWRSRPPLVELTSELFARAFAPQGIPPERVKLKPAPPRSTDVDGLGHIAEYWRLKSTNQATDHKSLAAGIKALLEDPEARVRDTPDGPARSIRPGDIAVLCRRGNRGQFGGVPPTEGVAGELAALGIPVVLPRSGLMKTAEATLALSALQLWVDPQDALAAATFARYMDLDRAGKWLVDAVRTPGIQSFRKLEPLKRIETARAERPMAGALAAYDEAQLAAGVMEICLAWGNPEERMANLEAMRARAAQYAQSCAQTGGACTPAGLVEHFRGLAEGEDSRGVPPADNAVTVGTWHSAKGLEWPIVVLYELGWERLPDPLGVHVLPNPDGFSLEDPLAGRTIRYWPYPYDTKESGVPLLERLENSAEMGQASDEHAKQELRLLYVGWTRAKDRIVLPVRAKKAAKAAAASKPVKASKAAAKDDGVAKKTEWQGGILKQLAADDLSWIPEPDCADGASEAKVTWGGHNLEVRVRTLVPIEVDDHTEATTNVKVLARSGIIRHPPSRVLPSEMKARSDARAGNPIEYGKRIALSGSPDQSALGSAVHAFFAADREELGRAERENLAQELLDRWQVGSALSPADLVEVADVFGAWLKVQWPTAHRLRELSIMRRLADGSILAGQADLVLELDEGSFIVFDHKTYPGSMQQAFERAIDHAGQVAAYAEALCEAKQSRCSGMFIHLPISGLIIPLHLHGAEDSL